MTAVKKKQILMEKKNIFNLEAKIESQVNICRLKSYKELKLIVIM